MAAYKCPGIWHDSTMANYGMIHDKMEDIYIMIDGRVLVVDSSCLGQSDDFVNCSFCGQSRSAHFQVR